MSEDLQCCDGNMDVYFSPRFFWEAVFVFELFIGKLLIYISLGVFFFLGSFVVPSLERYSSVFSFCLTVYVCLYELHGIALSLSVLKK